MVIKSLALASLAVALLCSCVRVVGDDTNVTVNGTVSYQPKMGLPANSILHLSVIEDDSGKHVWDKDLPLEHRDQIPIPFALDVPKSKVSAGHTYRLEAQIKIKDRAWYKGETKLPKELREDVKDLNMIIGPTQ